MSSEPPAGTPPIQQQSTPHQQCCHCLGICPKPSVDQAEDPNFHWQSDNSTVNDVDSDTESPPLVVHHNTRHSHAKLLRNQHALQRPVPSDPFDYEHKYPPDAKYKEMADRSRVFKTYMDESTKFDFDMVENWRDGLDMLLVFAALFSGVVTTFVVQTSQSLRVDYAQVTATLMLRLIHVQVAISEGASALVAELGHHTDPSDAFQAKSVDLWVNGLWFTSLVLSLTTTLVAVLTKQWINEYMILPTGTPRDRSRIRHFRFIGLQQWHVPLIIGLLPVLMHISLGVFFAGFIIFLCSLSYAMAKALGCVTGLGALAYLISNLLPLFFANCPYKTPLSLYSFRMVSSVRQCLQSWKACRRVQSSVIARSLKDVERAAVTYQAENLDALAVSWMHNTSSNASVQSIAVQSLAGLPPQSIGVVAGADGITAPVSNPDTWRFLDFVSQEDEERPAVIRAIRVHHRFDQPVDRMERMQRGALRFGAFNMLNKEQDRYQFIYDDSPERAIEAVQSSLLQPSGADTTFDVVFWGRLLEASMQSGLDFLNIESSYGNAPPSPVWCQLLKCAVQHHDCSFSNCHGIHDRELFSYYLGPEQFPLAMTRYDLETNGTSPTLANALSTNMRPSFVKWVMHVGFPHVKRSISNHTEHLPDDILLVLALLQTRSIQATSSLPESLHGNRIFSQVLDAVKDYILRLGTCIRHEDIDRAAIFALKAVVESEVFGTSTVMSLPDEAMIVRLLFYGLNRRYKLPSGPDDGNASWLTSDLFIRIWRVTTAALESSAVYNGWEVLSYVFTYVSHFPTQQNATETIYTYLMQHDWLHDIGLKLARLSKSNTPEIDKLPEMWCLGPNYIAATYLDVLAARTASSSEVIGKALEYIAEPAHLTALSRILMLSDSAMQNRLWQLASILRDKACDWPECVSNLSELVACAGMENEYDFVRLLLKFDGHGNKRLYYRPISELPSLVGTFSEDIAREHFTPPRDVVPHSQIIEEPEPRLESSPKELGFFRQWRKSFWRDTPDDVV